MDAGRGNSKGADEGATDRLVGHAAPVPVAGRRPAARLGWGLAICLALAACSSGLPPMPARQASTHLGPVAGSALASAYQPPAGDTALSGVVLLRDPLQALASRVLLARAAQRALDVQVYIWRPDASGQLLLHELWRAAQRGVRVRLLLDDNGSEAMDLWLQALAAQPGVEVRLFNPFGQRSAKALGYLSDFARLNQRMHAKSFTADSQATIVGGRNVGDVYFGIDAAVQFADLDLLALGPAAQATALQFDAHWNSALAYPVAAVLPPADPDALARHGRQLASLDGQPGAAGLAAGLQASPWLATPLAAGPGLLWAPVQLLSDGPDKVRANGPGAASGRRVFEPLAQALGSARQRLDLVSPYFVPGDAGVQGLVNLARRGVAVRIITNSLAATDVVASHAGYARHRRALLEAGIALFELKPDARPGAGAAPLPWSLRLAPMAAASLHGKTFVGDLQQVFVGSFNLDPRSAHLNTEMGLAVGSEALARALTERIDRDLPTSTYRLSLAADGALQWHEAGPAGEQVHASEPRAGLLRRLAATLLSWLPIEGLL